jgi:large subunit ribosomal protein L18
VEDTVVATSSRYCLPFRRRREQKTDYKARKAFLLSGKPRLVARCSNNNVSAQIILATPVGDRVVVSAESKELTKKHGWKAPKGNIPAAYLTGLLCGLKAREKGVDEAILDIGLYPPTKGARVFAVLKGILDAEVKVPHSEEKLPDDERVKGDHIAKYAQSIGSDSEEYKSRFSDYIKAKISPETLPEHIEQVKKDMMKAFKIGGTKVVAERPKRRSKKK